MSALEQPVAKRPGNVTNGGPPAIRVEGLWKKYCKTFRRGVYYLGRDLLRGALGREPFDGLRPVEFWSLADLSFELRRGECLGIIGPNGAGKSTLLKILSGIIEPTRGSVEIRGRVGSLIEIGAGFHPDLTGRENIYINGAILGLSTREINERFDEIVAFAGIGDFLNTPVRFYSSGMYVRLGFAVAAHTEPDVLLIDEVLAVGDVYFRMKCFTHLLKLMEKGTSILLVTHAVQQLARLTDRVLVLDGGRAIFGGSLLEGIGIYQHLLPLRADETRPAAKPGPRIRSVRLLDEQGRPKNDFQTSETLVAEIRLETRELVKDARLIAHVESSALGLLGGFATPHSNFHFDLVPPETGIRLRMPRLPLLVGGYHLHLGLAGPGRGELYDRRRPAATFRITGPPTDGFGFGVSDTIRFEHEWERLPETPAVPRSTAKEDGAQRLLCLSWPKAGTHVLLELARGLFGRGAWYRQPDIDPPREGPEALVRLLAEKMRRHGDPCALKGHLPWTPVLEDALEELEAAVLFIIRDPRDVLCSAYRWFMDLRPTWEISRYLRSLPNEKARLRQVIQGLPLVPPLREKWAVAWDKPLPERFAKLTPWTASPRALTVRFEDLVGGGGEAERRRQADAIRRILDFLGHRGENLASSIAASIVNPRAQTYHTCQRGTWVNYFGPEERELFVRGGGEELVRRFDYPPTFSETD